MAEQKMDQNEVDDRLNEINVLLLQMPPAADLGDLPLVIERSIVQLANSLRTTFAGGPTGQGSIITEWNKLARKFKDSIISSHPTITLQSKDDNRRIHYAAVKMARKEGSAGLIEATSEDVIDISDDDLPESGPRTNAAATAPDSTYRFQLEFIRNMNQDSQMIGNTRQTDPGVLNDMMVKSVSKWNNTLNRFLHALVKLLNSTVKRVVNDYFGQYKQYPFYTAITDWVKSYVDQAIHAQWSKAEETLLMEQRTPYTLDTNRQATLYQDNLGRMVKKRDDLRLRIVKAEIDVTNTKVSKKKLTVNDLPPDEFKVEIEMAAHVRAYYDIAAPRFVDNICQGIVSHLFTACSELLVPNLNQYIGVDRREQRGRLLDWFSNLPEIQRQRQDLIQERERLHESQNRIINLLRASDNASKAPSKTTIKDPVSPKSSSSLERAYSAISSTPLSICSKRSAPDDFDLPASSTGKRLAGMYGLSIGSSPTPRIANTSYRHPSVEDAPDDRERDGAAFL